MAKTALITGLTGQDGSYLAERLLELGYEVHGLVRRGSTITTHRVDHLLERVTIHYGDLRSSDLVASAVRPMWARSPRYGARQLTTASPRRNAIQSGPNGWPA